MPCSVVQAVGYKLQEVVERQWACYLARQLRALLVLNKMALVVPDPRAPGDLPLVYFGGWERLGHALGRVGPEQRVTEAVTRSLGVLREVGAITRVARSGRGQNARYVLNVDACSLFDSR
jgi:hypothetical protein